MSQTGTKVWVGVGAYVFSGVASAAIATTSAEAAPFNSEFSSTTSTVSATSAPAANQLLPFSMAQGGEGGEGDEGGEGSSAGFADTLGGPALVSALQSGGYVIYFRHAQTDEDYADQADPNLDLSNCSTQRTLSETGWQQARAIGEAFTALNIPVGGVYSSEYCRAWQTADLAFGRYEKDAALNFPPSEDYTEEQTTQMRESVMPFLTIVPADGTNTVIVGHDDVFDAATGIYPEPQGVAYILKPDGQGGFEIVADVSPEQWAELR